MGAVLVASASMAACCMKAGTDETAYWCTFAMAAATFSPAPTQPRRQPVMAQGFEKLFATMALSASSG